MRLFTGRSQRLSMLVAAAVAILAVLGGVATSLDSWSGRLALVLVVAAVALLTFWLVVVLPGRRYTPPSSRAADVVEALLVLSVLPLILGIMGVYGRVRELVG